jgi:hypothetical protein
MQEFPRALVHAIRSLLLAIALIHGAACEREAVDDRPEQVVEEFISRMQRVHGETPAARGAYELLWSEARKNLAERAKRASAVAGREVSPEEMLAPSRFSLAFKPKTYAARVEGNWAEVVATGDSPKQKKTIKCVREENRWRVVLEMPLLPPIQQRVDGGI